MHVMKIRDVIVALNWMLSVFPAFGLVEELDLYAWQTNQPLPRAWTASTSMLRKADAWKGGIYFTSKSGWLQSPSFDANVRSVSLQVATSSPNPPRRLYLHPISNGITNEQGIALDPTPTQSYVTQEFSLEEYMANQFVLKFDDVGDTGNWGLIYITVRYGSLEPGEKDDGTSGLWSMSSFAPRPGSRAADFSPLGGVIPNVLSNAWQNGQTVRGFHAFYASKPCTNVRIGSPSSPGGLYVIVTNDVRGSLRALALHGTGDWEASLMLPVAIDVERRVKRLCVDYRAWALGGTTPTDLNFSYRPLDDISDLKRELANEWTDVGGATWTSGERDPIRAVDVPTGCLRGRKYICFRWWVPKQTYSSLMGVSNVRVSAEVGSSGFAVIVK